MSDERVDVLVVGGGLAGLTCALFLSLHGVRPLLIEKHAGTSTVMKARGQYPHVMEMLRVGGVADDITAASPGGVGEFYMAVAETLSGPLVKSIMTQGEMSMRHVSSEDWAMASQERTEEILARRAAELGARLCFSTELASFTQDAVGVTATVVDRTSGERRTVRARYLVGADGRHSPVRTALGVGLHGRGRLGEVFRVFFDADMRDRLGAVPGAADGSRFALFHLLHPLPGVFYTTDVPGRYGYIRGLTKRHPDFGRFTKQDCEDLVRTGLGVPDLELAVAGTGRTEIVCDVADRFSAGRVHLIGDAARTVPAPGGLGGNTAIADGFYLAWKLAMVVRGQAGPALLDSHDSERRPVSDMIAEQQYSNTVERLGPELDDGTHVPQIPPVVQVFGYRCVQGAVVREPDDAGELLEDPTAPTGRPGSRGPCVPVRGDGAATTTTALFGAGFVLLAGRLDTHWAKAGREVARRLGIRLDVHLVEDAEPAGRATGASGAEAARDPRSGGRSWRDAYGIGEGGAVLVRPDRFIAWRSRRRGTAADLEQALRTVLDRA